MEHSPGIRRIALEEFTRRRAAWLKARAEGAADWPGDPANENLRLWLAIALAAGVGRDLPDDVCAAIEVEAIFPYRQKFLPTADSIADRAVWQAELARARDVAITRSEVAPRDLRAEQRARDLIGLAEALGAPGIDWNGPAATNGRAAA